MNFLLRKFFKIHFKTQQENLAGFAPKITQSTNSSIATQIETEQAPASVTRVLKSEGYSETTRLLHNELFKPGISKL